MTLIQRCGSALNLDIHFQMPVLDGLYVECPGGSVRFRPVGRRRAPSSPTRLTGTIADVWGGLSNGRGCSIRMPRTTARMLYLIIHSFLPDSLEQAGSRV